MVMIMESYNLEECCAALGGNRELLFELRDGLRGWLKLQPHLPQDVSDQLLEQMIIGSKMSLELAKQKLDMFYSLKPHAPEIFADRDPRKPSLSELYKMVQMAYLPKLTPEKNTVLIMRPIANSYNKFRATDSLKYLYMLEDIVRSETHYLGHVTIFDMSKVTIGYIAAHTPAMIKKSEVIATEAYAIRLKGIHLINASGFTNQAIGLAKSALKPKISGRIHVHLPGNYESLREVIPKSILPKDYGGDEISMDELCEKWRQKVDDWRDWFLEQEKISVDERLRPGAAIDTDNLFGMSGSFRKLNVD